MDIVARLNKISSRHFESDEIKEVCSLAADEIEYLRQRCEEIDREWRLTMEGKDGRI